MIRFDPDEDEDMSEEKRFYYLRLMAKPGRKPIKTKFVTWSPEQQSSSREDDPVLEVVIELQIRSDRFTPLPCLVVLVMEFIQRCSVALACIAKLAHCAVISCWILFLEPSMCQKHS